MQPDLTQGLKDAENPLRDFIAATLEKEVGRDWIENSGVSDDRIQKWQDRRVDEAKRQRGGTVEPRLIYYADFYDIKTILKNHWSKFTPALGDWKTIKVFLDQLAKLRDPDAHRRELLPHQKSLGVGIAGEIRTRIIRYRSKLETADDYFPRIESARDSLGNIWTAGIQGASPAIVTKSVLRPGNIVDYVVTASDPLGDELEFQLVVGHLTVAIPWQKENTLSLPILEEHISRPFLVMPQIRSPRKHHAANHCDHWVEFYYSVIPNK